MCPAADFILFIIILITFNENTTPTFKRKNITITFKTERNENNLQSDSLEFSK